MAIETELLQEEDRLFKETAKHPIFAGLSDAELMEIIRHNANAMIKARALLRSRQQNNAKGEQP